MNMRWSKLPLYLLLILTCLLCGSCRRQLEKAMVEAINESIANEIRAIEQKLTPEEKRFLEEQFFSESGEFGASVVWLEQEAERLCANGSPESGTLLIAFNYPVGTVFDEVPNGVIHCIVEDIRFTPSNKAEENKESNLCREVFLLLRSIARENDILQAELQYVMNMRARPVHTNVEEEIFCGRATFVYKEGRWELENRHVFCCKNH